MFNKKNRIILLSIIIVLILSFSACSGQIKEDKKPIVSGTENDTYPIKVIDSYNREVTIESEPMRVISVAPSITETIFVLEVEDRLVGRTDYCNYPQEVENIESIGGLQNPNIEKIIDLKPDLVIASTHFEKAVLEKLEEAGIKVVVFYGEESFDGVYEVMEKVGQVFNEKDKANLIISDMKNRVENVIKRVKDLDEKDIYYVVGFGDGGDFTAGGDTFIGSMIEMAGGRNAADDIEGWKYSLEGLIEKDPDILICSNEDGTKESLMKANGYKELTAVKEGRVYEIDKDLLQLQGPRLVEGLEKLSQIIHPSK
ncbi:ABC transporter substrate-binding protein [Maledivibacter halophilus]|uniref:Iron complex transport system substrate-binding protein n=1 Tax=Maledivibacter halophilus TaxID=36842 RepID=A0A1T5IGK5_9FIRM|nr:ABC transporter substrate-binding protein [Maledivibacter halophilus]SKC38265.1 iron complex transport system substrate-binding protein [Maledivibacter halophilus]